MGIFEAIVVYTGAWWLIFLPTLSAGQTSQRESGAVAPGTEGGAPVKVGWATKLLIPTIGAAVVTFLLWLALHMRWLDFMVSSQ
jgi:predicted secreted protein